MTETAELFRVVRNAEEQHAIWQTYLEVPPGWEEIGFVGTKEACLRHVQAVWPDITPLSVRRVRAS